MALTLKTNKQISLGNARMALMTATGDGSYPAGGYPLPKSALGMVIVNAVQCAPAFAPGANPVVYPVAYDAKTTPSAPKLRFFSGVGQEVAGGTSLANVQCDLAVYGV